MERKKASDYPQELLNLFDKYVHGDIGRRDFLDCAQKFAVGGLTATAQSIVATTVKNVNRQLPSFEQIRKFKILDRDFTIEHGELTPTMKLRRSRALENHRALVTELYAGREFE